MCLAIPARVTEVLGDARDLVKVDVAGARRSVNILLLDDDVAAGDWVLVHVGFAMAKIDEAEAMLTIQALQSMGQAYASELEAITQGSSLTKDRSAISSQTTIRYSE